MIAFTCCVGEMYAELLRKSIARWAACADKVVIVTKPGDAITKVTLPGNVLIVETTVFDLNDAAFNKGAALNVAYAAMDARDHVVHFDSDIVPPHDWWKTLRAHAPRGKIVGAPRTTEKGRIIDDRGLYPYGYLQCWHAQDPRVWRWPLFDVHSKHAGSYDANFLELWPRQRRRLAPFTVVHIGEIRTNWFGPGQEGNQEMADINAEGPYQYRIRTNKLEYTERTTHISFKEFQNAYRQCNRDQLERAIRRPVQCP